MQAVELKVLKEQYVSLWFKGLLLGFFGIANMYFLVEAGYGVLHDEDVSLMFLANMLAVGVCAHISLDLKTRRDVILEKIRPLMKNIS